MDKTRELGVIADLQCGGWSTSILNNRGAMYTVGVLNGERGLFASDKCVWMRELEVGRRACFMRMMTVWGCEALMICSYGVEEVIT